MVVILACKVAARTGTVVTSLGQMLRGSKHARGLESGQGARDSARGFMSLIWI